MMQQQRRLRFLVKADALTGEAAAPAVPQSMGAAAALPAPTAGRARLLLPVPPAPGTPVRGHIRRTADGARTVRPHGRKPAERRLPPPPAAGTGEPAGEQLALTARPDGAEVPLRGPVAQALPFARQAAPQRVWRPGDAQAQLDEAWALMEPDMRRGVMPPPAFCRRWFEAAEQLEAEQLDAALAGDDGAEDRWHDTADRQQAMIEALAACAPRAR
jgi:hypothetical protein